MLVAPAEVFQDRPGKEHVLLQDHGDFVSQRLQVIRPHVPATDEDLTGGHVIQTADEVHEAGLGAAGAADDADGLTGRYLEIDVPQDGLFGVLAVSKVHVAELHGAVGDVEDGVLRVGQVGLLVQHGADPLGAGGGHGHHDEDHGEHHEAH